MAITAGEQQTGGEVRDNDGRLIVVGPGGVAIGGGGGTVDITDRAGRLLGHVTVDNFPGTQPVSGPLTDTQLRALAVAVSGPLTDAQLRASAVPVSGTFFQATQPVSGTTTANQGTPNTAANKWPTSVTDGTNTAQVLNSAPGSDTGQSALAVRVVSQLGAGAGGGSGTQFAEDAALGATPTGTLAMARRTDTLGTLTPVVDDAVSQRTNSRGALWVVHDGSISIANFPATQAVSGTVTANAGTGPFPVSDNGGSLTVDAPVGTPLRVDPTGTTTQPVSGTVTANAGTGTFTTDPSDRATRELGRARLWDGTDEATVIPRGAVPSASDKGLAVVSLNVSRPAYQVVSANLTSPTAIAVTQVLTLWHPNTVAKDVYIIEMGVNYQAAGWTAGRFDFRLQFISAENGTPGGTTLTAQPLDLSLPASGVVARAQPTGAATATGQIFQRAAQLLPGASNPYITAYDGVVIYRAKDLDDYSDAIRLRSGISEGLAVQQDIIVAITGTAPIFNIYARYIERA